MVDHLVQTQFAYGNLSISPVPNNIGYWVDVQTNTPSGYHHSLQY